MENPPHPTPQVADVGGVMSFTFIYFFFPIVVYLYMVIRRNKTEETMELRRIDQSKKLLEKGEGEEDEDESEVENGNNEKDQRKEGGGENGEKENGERENDKEGVEKLKNGSPKASSPRSRSERFTTSTLLATKSQLELFTPIILSFDHITYSVKAKKKKSELGPSTYMKVLINDISGVIKAGSLTAIMGPSGCGKSTLLDILADRKESGQLDGRVYVNGYLRDPYFKRFAAYVMQSDVLFSGLTVRETLTFAAMFRLPNDMPEEEKLNRVEVVMEQLDLGFVADTVIGDASSGKGGLSGGQKRRVTVGVELITNPTLLFLDEPTSGLDSYSSFKLVSTLRRLADIGKTVICTIHQPRTEIFDLFDTLLLMKAGELAYLGPISMLSEYFAGGGMPIPKFMNPADFVVDLTYEKESDVVPNDIETAIAQNPSINRTNSIEGEEKKELVEEKEKEEKEETQEEKEKKEPPSPSVRKHSKKRKKDLQGDEREKNKRKSDEDEAIQENKDTKNEIENEENKNEVEKKKRKRRSHRKSESGNENENVDTLKKRRSRRERSETNGLKEEDKKEENQSTEQNEDVNTRRSRSRKRNSEKPTSHKEEKKKVEMSERSSDSISYSPTPADSIFSGRSRSSLKLDTKITPENLTVYYRKSKFFLKFRNEIQSIIQRDYPNLPKNPALQFSHSSNALYASSLWSQVTILTRRAWLNNMRNWGYYVSWLLGLVMFLFYGLLYLGLQVPGATFATGTTDSLVYFQSQAGFLYQLLAGVIFLHLDEISIAFLEKNMYLRESASGSYSALAYQLAWYLRSVLTGLLRGIIFSPFVYWLGGLKATADAYFFFNLVIAVMDMTGSSLAIMMIAIFDSLRMAQGVFTTFGSMMQTISGFFLLPNIIPPWVIWIYYLSYLKYSLEALYENQFEGISFPGIGDLLANYFFVDPSLNKLTNALILMFFPLFFHTVSWFFNWRKTTPKKPKSSSSFIKQ